MKYKPNRQTIVITFSTEQIQKYTTVTVALKTLQNPSPIHM